MSAADPIELEIFRHLFASIAEEMGVRLMRSAYSPNIKERRDHSCVLVDANAEIIAQAAHIPVHLGSAPMSVQAALEAFPGDALSPNDVIVLNDPFAGGTHLPDITLVAPCFVADESTPRFFVANRAHHADVGGVTAGSMPISRSIHEEGVRITPRRLDEETIAWICEQSRTPEERRGDLNAQLAAIHLGVQRMRELCERYNPDVVSQRAAELQGYTERIMRHIIGQLADGVYRFEDVMDDDGTGLRDLTICCDLTVRGDTARVDLSRTADQSPGPVNAVRAIVVSAVNYAFRCLAPADLPSNGGVLRPIQVITRAGSLIDAQYPAAVAAGNVETSQRIVDVLFGALAQAAPDLIPAASCGSMNNITIGGLDSRRGGAPYAYYETIAGGAGASPEGPGADAVHTHMTNTLNTPVEALEHAYPFRVEAYRIRNSVGGAGRFRGGRGVERVYAFTEAAQVTLLTERRSHAPYGLNGGKDGTRGRNTLLSQGEERALPAKVTLEVEPGDTLTVETPGGGGWGSAPIEGDDHP
ncbi:MAG: 5-oxoprolinase [Myxococcales bacterium]|nr:5-oxoprolinase [Myxococcales bacterium]